MQVNAIKALGATAEMVELQAPGSNVARVAGANEEAMKIKAETAGEPEVLSPHDVSQAVRELNAAVKSLDSGLRFHIDEASNQVVVEVVNEATGEVLRQIPSEVSIRLAQTLGKAAGLLVDKRA